MIQVRRIQPKDLQQLIENGEALGFDQTLMMNSLQDMMVVINDSEICGIGCYIRIEDKCLLNWIRIKEGRRRDRLGTMLVKTMLNSAEHQGALQAFMFGGCREFAEFLGFQDVESHMEEAQIRKLYKEAFLSAGSEKLFKVSLVGYFKPCCHQ